ncbi:MAG: UbiH/UbiF family hydroxylase [Zoogloeaceae bacterium]|jgi:ubiquinone biosynthesis UbiH/UbiF/VisC/COQ6 family hydroxylase|nr:UbiH/UbiF family hydroxylase [Zoogloeaceae bacterium]
MFDLIILGGGLAGASLAVALRDTPLSIALVEAVPPVCASGWDPRIYTISPANARFLGDIGVWEHLEASRIAPIETMEVAGDKGGRLCFSAAETGVPELGWVLESSRIACELWENLKRQRNLTRFCPARPQHLDFSEAAANLTLADGQALSARLIVGADGRDSWVRGAAGLEALGTPYHEQGVVANFATEKPHGNSARQWFRNDGVLAWLPLPDQRVSIVWATPDAQAAELLALPETGLAERVAAAGGHALGALKTLTPAAAFPLRLIRVPRLVAHRIALVGDAGHGIHPLSGHGVNLGFQDARVLAERLRTAPEWQDIGEEAFLRRYQRDRREEILFLQTATDALRRLFRAPSAPLAGLRNAGFSLTDKLTPLKTWLARYAIGAAL